MATVRDYSSKWKYELIDLGLSTRWTDRNFMATNDIENGIYLPFGMPLHQLDSDYLFTETAYKEYSYDIDEIEGKSIVATANDAIFDSDNALRLPTEHEIEELIYNCHWAVVFQHTEKEPFKRRIKWKEHYTDQTQTIGINRKLIVYLDYNFATEEIINSKFDDYDLIDTDEVQLKNAYSNNKNDCLPKYDLYDKWEFDPYYLIAYKTNINEDGIKFPFTGICERDWNKNQNKIYNSSINGISEIIWSVEIPFGEIFNKKGSNYIGILDFTITSYDSLEAPMIFNIPKRPIIRWTKKAWVGRNYRGVENINTKI